MVCATAVLSSSLALSLLRQSSSPSESFVLSPFSLNSALSIVHDGASGNTQNELTNLLLKGCTPSDVTNHYSSLALGLPPWFGTGVSFKSANRFYVDNSISLNKEYQKNIEDKYRVKVEGIKLRAKVKAAKEINKFVEGATNGKIKELVKADDISDDTKTILINAISFLGIWKNSFDKKSTTKSKFYGVKGERQIDFMKSVSSFNISQTDSEITLILPYENKEYSFFLVMPKNFEKMRNEINGEKLQSLLKNTKSMGFQLSLPKFSLSSGLDGKEVLQKLGVNEIFNGRADLSKTSSSPLLVSKIQHKAVIEIDEKGTTAAAATSVHSMTKSLVIIQEISIDHPFLFGILRGDDILFIGQFA